MLCHAFQISSCSPDQKLRNTVLNYLQRPLPALFNSRSSEPLEFLSLFHCHQQYVFRLSGLSFVLYYASWIVAVKQNICPEGNYCSCHEKLFEATVATGMSVMALQPPKTLEFSSLKAVTRFQVPGTYAECNMRSPFTQKKIKQPNQTTTSNPVTMNFRLCFNKSIHLSVFISTLTIFSNKALFTVVCFKQHQNRH